MEGAVSYSQPAKSATVPKPIIDEIPPPPVSGITIEFPFSSSQSFDFAVAEAKKFPTFQQYGDGKKSIYRITIDPSEVSTIIPLAEHMKGWRNRFVYLDGERVPWDSIFSHLWCYESKLASYKPEFYCFGYENEWSVNPWGCMQAHMPFRERADWFTWGKWINDQGDWEFDKDRIRHELQKNLFQYRFCTAMKIQLVEAVLGALPAVVNPSKNRNWKFVENWEDDGRPALKRVTKDEWGYVETVFLVGVEPNGRNALEEIAKKVGFQLR